MNGVTGDSMLSRQFSNPCGIINFDLFYYIKKLQLSIQLGVTGKQKDLFFISFCKGKIRH